jgi:hypothetical protein
MQRQLFPKDKTLHDVIKSDEFQKLLGTDATTEEGQEDIAEYYEAAKDWKALKKQGKEKGTIADAASAYYYLLKTVKCESKKDDVWMTFYEGLHQHSLLLSSTFNIKIGGPVAKVPFFQMVQISHLGILIYSTK